MSGNTRFSGCAAVRQGALIAAGLCVLLLLDGCMTATRHSGPRGPDAGPAAAGESVRVESGSLASATGCMLTYDLYRPAAATTPAQVVLAHGFLRSKERMAGLATALARAGLATVAVDLCNMRAWDGAHRQNAADLQRVATTVGGGDRLYAGFSAGGLAALLAAVADPRSAGVLVLDPVDQDRMGERAAAALAQPIIGLVGDASPCNAGNNGLVMLEVASDAEIIRFDGASHCDFESPTDGVCRLICERGATDAQRSARTRADIIEASVQAARRLLGPEKAVRPAPAPGG